MKYHLKVSTLSLYSLPTMLVGSIGYCVVTRGYSEDMMVQAAIYGMFSSVFIGSLIRWLFVFESNLHGFSAYTWYGSKWFFEWNEVEDRKVFSLLGESYTRVTSIHGGNYYLPSRILEMRNSV